MEKTSYELPKKTIILNENKEFEVVSVFDNDGTIQKHSNLAMLLHNILIESSFNSLSGTKKRILKNLSKLVSPFATSHKVSSNKVYQDIINIADNLHSISLNTIYTLNNADNTYSFLKQNDILKYFDMIIEAENKNPFTLNNGLLMYPTKSGYDIRDSPMIVFGDNRCDFDCSCYEEHDNKKFYIGLESGLEKKLSLFKEKCDVFVPKTIRTSGETAKHIGKTICDYLESVGYSDKMNKTDIFKYMETLFKVHDKENSSSYQKSCE